MLEGAELGASRRSHGTAKLRTSP